MRKSAIAAVLGVALTGGAAWSAGLPQQNDATFKQDAADLAARLKQQPNTNRAKNIILFIGDGMSISTITAARIYAGQKKGLDGASYRLTMDTLPYAALSRTYSADSIVTDSAPSATSMTAGIKAKNGTIGVNDKAMPRDCAKSKGTDVTTIFELAEMAHLSTGIITTTRVTHATPAAAYAHTPGRDWEADSDMLPNDRKPGCKDIADQLVHWNYGDGFEVILGGGRQKMFGSHDIDPQDPSSRGERGDNRNLVEEWKARYNGDAAYVWNEEQFKAVDPSSTKRLMGLFNRSYMQYETERAKTNSEPSLAEMTAKAIDILKKNPEGYVLMVEGGRIDHAHHAGNAARALEDTIAFDDAIKTGLAMTDAADTLIIVTADHSHTLQIVGYPSRGNPILGVADEPPGREKSDSPPTLDGLPYTTLQYANGPGASQSREGLTNAITTNLNFLQPALVPMSGETHAGDDVAILASGPWAQLFSGIVDENFIYHVMAYASQLPQRAGVQ